MNTKTRKRKVMETIAGASIGAAIAGPVGAVAGGLVASKVDAGVERTGPERRSKPVAVVAADDPMAHVWLKRILVPLDFSPPSRRALRFAREWADFFSAEVCLLHVVDTATMSGDFGPAPVGTVQRDIPGKAKAALRELAQTEFPDSIPVRVLVRKGTPYDQIAAAAREIQADVIIVATHGRTGLKHALLGSTAERVAWHAPCPVLILRRSAEAA